MRNAGERVLSESLYRFNSKSDGRSLFQKFIGARYTLRAIFWIVVAFFIACFLWVKQWLF